MGSYRLSAVWENGQEVTYENTNGLLNPDSEYYHPYVTGLKTGRSSRTGCCLVSSVCFQSEIYICEVMGSKESGRFTDSLKICEALAGQVLQAH